MYEIKTQNFEGPLSLLLDLIEQEKLDITEVSLSQVTDQYLAHIAEMEQEIHPDSLADFLLIAAKLLAIKSRVLLPSVQGDGDEGVLEEQLKMYRRYRDAARIIDSMAKAGAVSFARKQPRQRMQPFFAPPQSLTRASLHRAYVHLCAELKETLFVLPKKRVAAIISINERIVQLREFFEHARTGRFSEIALNSKNKAEVVVSFLALLELIKQRHFLARQIGEDIHISPYA